MKISKIKTTNSGIILKILLNQDVSQTGLVKITGLRKPSISAIIGQLKSKGMVLEKGIGISGNKGGRKPRLLELSRKNIVGIGASFRDLVLKTEVVDLTGLALWSEDEKVKENHSSCWVPALKEKIREIRSDGVLRDRIFAGLGFSTGGIYNPSKEVFSCFTSGHTRETRNDEKDFSLKQALAPEFPDMRVAADDFPNAMAKGEMWFGCAKDVDDFIYLQLCNPKATIVTDRAIVRGSRFFAGEVAGMRYGGESISGALKRTRYSPEVVADFLANLVLCYSPEKIILSLENLPEGAPLAWDEIRKKLKEKLGGIELAGLETPPIEKGMLGGPESSVAAAALLFDRYINSFTLRQGGNHVHGNG
jgi:predicted NBD/HSP70 family sugar kinase